MGWCNLKLQLLAGSSFPHVRVIDRKENVLTGGGGGGAIEVFHTDLMREAVVSLPSLCTKLKDLQGVIE